MQKILMMNMWIHANKHDAYLELSQLFFFQLVVPEYSIHGLFCLMFMCAGEWVTLGLNIPLLLYHLWRYKLFPHSHLLIFEISKWVMVTIPPHFFLPQVFHRLQTGLRLCMIQWVLMNADILNYCQKESWCKLGFYLLSFFYYLYR